MLSHGKKTMLIMLLFCRYDRVFLVAFMISIALLANGCRQNPPDNPKYYARELEQMRRDELRAAAAEEDKKFLKDGYPWRGKTSAPTCLPCNIKSRETELAAESRHIHETIYGQKKTRIKFRD